MDLTAERIDIGTRTPTVLLNVDDAAELGVHALDRIQMRHDGGTTVGIVEVTDELVDPGRLGVTDHLRHVEGEVAVSIAPRPESVSYLTKKLDDVDLSPVDDKIIRAETPLSLDPPGQVVASVLSKKEAAGSTHVVVDIPFGESAKVASLADAREMAEDFARVGDSLGMTVECAITRGGGPIGRGIGPVLEARDVLAVLDGDGPGDLRAKSLDLARRLFAICDVDRDPVELLASGAAREAFEAIVDAQGGDPGVAVGDLRPGRHERTVTADRTGTVAHVDNRGINELARRAGAPRDRGAGVYLHARTGETVEVDEDLFTVHAEKRAKLDEADRYLDRADPVRVRRPDETLVESV